MAFEPKQYDGGKIETLKLESGQGCSKGDALEVSGGYFRQADSATTEVRFVAMEGKAAASGAQDLEVVRTDGVIFHADTNDTPARAQVGTKADLENASDLNENATSVNVFHIDRIVGSSDDNTVRGVFT